MKKFSVLAILFHVTNALHKNSHGKFPYIKVLKSTLNMNIEATGISGAHLIDSALVKGVTDLTLCIRFNYPILGDWEGGSQLIHIEDWRYEPSKPKFQLLNLGANYPRTFFTFGHPQEKGSFQSYLLKDMVTGSYEIWSTSQWNHFCLSYQSDGTIITVRDGRTLNVNFKDNQLANVSIPTNFLSKVYLGRCGYDYTTACSLTIGGKIADFNVWGKALTEKEMQDWTTCRNLQKGNLVNWDNVEFELSNMTVINNVGMEQMCLPTQPGHTLMPNRMSYDQAKLTCRRFGGEMTVVTDQNIQNELVTKAIKRGTCNTTNIDVKFWAGWSEPSKERLIVSASTDQRILKEEDFQPWGLGEPNGDTAENCITVRSLSVAESVWYDTSCDKQQCFFCSIIRMPTIQLRGLCKNSKFDSKYSITKQMLQRTRRMVGFRGTTIYAFKDERGRSYWRMELPNNNDTTHVEIPGEDFPFGVQNWTLFGSETCIDSKFLFKGNKAIISLNLNGCTMMEYGCNNGECIDVQKRCDGEIDCSDRSDEFNCQLVSVDSSYIQEFSPPPEKITGEKVTIKTALKILSVYSISEVDDEISVQVQLDTTWKDSRLIFNDLKPVRRLNVLTRESIDKIWFPQIVFNNSRGRVSSVADEESLSMIVRQGSYRHSSIQELNNRLIFSGADNPIISVRVYELNLSCHFDMGTYPFDSQRCDIILVMKGNGARFVNLVGESVSYLGPVDLKRFYVEHVHMLNHTNHETGLSHVSADITFRRRLLSTVMTTYLPTVLLCVVCFSTTCFKPEYFEAAVTVNLTSLLVLTTFFIGIFNSLPQTSYIKMIDVWMVANLFIPFLEVLLVTLAENYRLDYKITRINDMSSNRKSSDVQSNRKLMIVTKLSKVGLPFTYIIFVVTYFVIGISMYTNTVV